MLQGLTSSNSIIRVVNQEFDNQILYILTGVRNQFYNASPFNTWKIEFHMSCVFLKIIKKGLIWGAKDIVDLVHLVDFIVSRKEWE